MDAATPDRTALRWLLAGAAALVTLVVLAVVIGSLVPRGTQGTMVAGFDIDELKTACKLVGGDDAMRCQRVARVDAALDEGRCSAAKVQARPLQALDTNSSSLAVRLKDYAEARLAQACPEG